MNNTIQRVMHCLAIFAISGFAYGGVFDDCVYWFCGGRDSDGDGLLKNNNIGEMVDSIHASDLSDDIHKIYVQGYARISGQESLGVQLREEDVYCPAQGVTNRTMCVYIPQHPEFTDNGNGTITTNFCNNMVKYNSAHKLFSILTNAEYTCIMRLRRGEANVFGKEEWFFNTYQGNTIESNKGMLLGFNKNGAFTSYAPQSTLSVTSPTSVPTNTWADIAIIVSNDTVRLGAWVDLGMNLTNRGDSVRAKFTSTTTGTKTVDGVKYRPNLAPYKLFIGSQHDLAEKKNYETNIDKMFEGSVQQIAFWGRVLTDDEVVEAWQTPMADVWRLGLSNDSSSEMGGTTASVATVDIDSITADGRWQDVPGEIAAGGALNLDFTFRKSRFAAGKNASSALSQILCVKPLSVSSGGTVQVTVNGASVGSAVALVPGETATLFISSTYFSVSGVNRISLVRTDGGASAIGIDQIRLIGSFQTGIADDSPAEFSYRPGQSPGVSWPQSSDWYDMRNALNPRSGDRYKTVTLKIRLPNEVVPYKHIYTVRMREDYSGANTNVLTLAVNGDIKAAWTNDSGIGIAQIPTSFAEFKILFKEDELLAGINEFTWTLTTANTASGPSPILYFDSHKLEAKDSKGFVVIFR